MLQRAALSRVRAEPDPRRKLSLYGEFVAEVSPRHVPFQLLVRSAEEAGDMLWACNSPRSTSCW